MLLIKFDAGEKLFFPLRIQKMVWSRLQDIQSKEKNKKFRKPGK